MSIKISELPSAVSVNNTDIVPIVQNGVTKKADASLIKTTFGTSAGTACEGNDARLNNSRTPSGTAGGDLVGSYPNPTLSTTGVAALTYGSSSQVGQFTVDEKGRITTAASVAISASAIGAVATSQLGVNVATFLATPSSANFKAAITDETGSGSVVFGTNPTIQEPAINGYNEGVIALGVIGASPAQLSISNGTVITATLTAGTSTTITLPPVAVGKSFVLYIKQPASGTPASVTFATSPSGSIAWPSGISQSVTATAGRLDVFSFVSDGTKWYGASSKNYTY